MEPEEIVRGLREEVQRAREDITLIMEVNVKLRKELKMLEKLIELNIKDGVSSGVVFQSRSQRHKRQRVEHLHELL